MKSTGDAPQAASSKQSGKAKRAEKTKWTPFLGPRDKIGNVLPMRGGFMYLVAIMDWHSRHVLSWRLSNSMDVDFRVDALEDALSQTSPENMNTDQGSQFTSRDFTAMLTKHSLSISMDCKGRAIDNVLVERRWRTFKYEEIYLKEYTTVTDLEKGLRSYFNYYATERKHSSLDHQTPAEVYRSGRSKRFDFSI